MPGQTDETMPLRTLALPDPDATDAFGTALAPLLRSGDTVLLSGPIGAGKSHLARTVIRRLMERHGEAPEDIPSPTYTLVQTYPAGALEIWHADLYRLSDPAEVFELGLDEAFGTAICLVEWPDRLGGDIPADALSITIEIDGEGRRAELHAAPGAWADRLRGIASDAGATE